MDKGKGIKMPDDVDDNKIVPPEPSCEDDENEMDEYESSIARALADSKEKWTLFKETIEDFVKSRMITYDVKNKLKMLFDGRDHLEAGLDRFLCLSYKKETGIENSRACNQLDSEQFYSELMERFENREPTKWNEFMNTLILLNDKKISDQDFGLWMKEFLKGHEDLIERYPIFCVVDQSPKNQQEKDPHAASTSSS